MIDRISAFCGSAWRNNSRCYMGRCRIRTGVITKGQKGSCIFVSHNKNAKYTMAYTCQILDHKKLKIFSGQI